MINGKSWYSHFYGLALYFRALSLVSIMSGQLSVLVAWLLTNPYISNKLFGTFQPYFWYHMPDDLDCNSCATAVPVNDIRSVATAGTGNSRVIHNATGSRIDLTLPSDEAMNIVNVRAPWKKLRFCRTAKASLKSFNNALTGLLVALICFMNANAVQGRPLNDHELNHSTSRSSRRGLAAGLKASKTLRQDNRMPVPCPGGYPGYFRGLQSVGLCPEGPARMGQLRRHFADTDIGLASPTTDELRFLASLPNLKALQLNCRYIDEPLLRELRKFRSLEHLQLVAGYGERHPMPGALGLPGLKSIRLELIPDWLSPRSFQPNGGGINGISADELFPNRKTMPVLDVSTVPNDKNITAMLLVASHLKNSQSLCKFQGLRILILTLYEIYPADAEAISSLKNLRTLDFWGQRYADSTVTTVLKSGIGAISLILPSQASLTTLCKWGDATKLTVYHTQPNEIAITRGGDCVFSAYCEGISQIGSILQNSPKVRSVESRYDCFNSAIMRHFANCGLKVKQKKHYSHPGITWWSFDVQNIK